MSSSVKQRETGRISFKWIWRIIFFFRCCFLLLCSPDCVCTQQLCSSSQLRENDPLLALSHGGFIEYKGYKKKSSQTEIQFKNKRSLFPQKKLNVSLSPICWASTMAFSWEAAGWWTAENRMSLLHTGPHGLQHIESDTGYISCVYQ